MGKALEIVWCARCGCSHAPGGHRATPKCDLAGLSPKDRHKEIGGVARKRTKDAVTQIIENWAEDLMTKGTAVAPVELVPESTTVTAKMSRAELETFVTNALAEKDAKRVAKRKAQAKWRKKSKKKVSP